MDFYHALVLVLFCATFGRKGTQLERKIQYDWFDGL